MITFKDFYLKSKKLDEALRDGVTVDGTKLPRTLANWNKLQYGVASILNVPTERFATGENSFAKAFGDWADGQELSDVDSKFLEEFGKAEMKDSVPQVGNEAQKFAHDIASRFEVDTGWKF